MNKAIVVLNRGVCGCNSRQGLMRLPKLLKTDRPQILIIGFGVNDALNSSALVEIGEFEMNIKKMIETAEKSGVRSIVINTINPIIADYVKARHQYSFDEDLNRRVERYNQVLRKIVQLPDILLNDFHKLVSTGNLDELLQNEANSGIRDGLHLTAAGAGLLGESIAALLKEHVKPGEIILCLGDSITYGVALPGCGTSNGSTYPAKLEEILRT
jgi:acyl-CoA thioesterase-1